MRVARKIITRSASLAGVLLAAGGAAPPGSAAAAEEDRIAVLILADSQADVALADNLTEIVIARIAETRSVKLAGTGEFRRRLGIENEQRARTCLEDSGCLGRVGVGLGVSRVVGGSVRAEEGHFLVNLTLTDIESGRSQRRFFRRVQGSVADLVRATQEGTDELFRPREEPGRLRVTLGPEGSQVSVDGLYIGTTPVISGPLLPGPHKVRIEREGHFSWSTIAQIRPAGEVELKLTSDLLPRRRKWPAYLAGGAVAGSVLLLAVGTTLGALSQIEPSGGTRRDVQDDLKRRRGLATSANVMFIGGALLAGVGLAAYAFYSRDIHGE